MIKTKVNNEVKVISGGKKELRFANKSAFPQTGNSEYVYIALDENKIYRYDTTTSTYVAIGGSDLTAGNGISISNNEIAIDSQVVETATHASSTYQTQSGMSAYRTSANQDIIDNGKENTSNKVSSWQETPDNTHYPSEKLVKDSISAETSARESADTNLQTQINTLASQDKFMSDWNCETGLAVTDPPTSPYTYPVGAYFVVSVVSQTTNYRPNGSTYTIGVASTTLETDTVKVGDKYIYDGSVWYLQKVDESNFVTLNTAQNILSIKTIGNSSAANCELDFTSNDNQTYKFLKTPYSFQLYNNIYGTMIQCVPTQQYVSITQTLRVNNLQDANGTDSASVYQLANGVMGMPAPSSTTLTDAEYAELTNGKPHQIVGTFLGQTNPLLLGAKQIGNNYVGTIISTETIGTYIIIGNSKTISIRSFADTLISYRMADVNGKVIPSYPSNTGYFEFAQSNGTLSWIDKSVVTITDTTYSGAFASAKTYNFTNAMTSLAISGFETQSGDLNPSWNLHLIAGANFALTLPSGATWKYGTPQFTQGSEYTIQIEPRLTSGTYYLYLV